MLAAFWIIRPWAGCTLVIAILTAYAATTRVVVVDRQLAIALTTVFLIASAGFPLNDIYDLTIDRRAHPGRPLVRGDMSVPAAALQAVGMLALAVGLASLLGLVAAICATAVSLVVMFYSRIKDLSAVVGNLLTAALFAGALTTPLFTQEGPLDESLLLGFAGLCLFLIFGREVVKDIQDGEMDAAYGRRTIPVVYGPQRGYKVAGLSVCLAAVVAIFVSAQNEGYARWSAVGTALFLLCVGVGLVYFSAPEMAKRRVLELRIVLFVALALLGSATLA